MRPVNLWQRAQDGTVDATATLKVLCIYLTAGLFLFLGAGATTSLIYQVTHDGRAIEPSDGWLTVLAYILTFLAAVFGITGGITIGKWATAPKAAEAQVIKENLSATAEHRAAASVAKPVAGADVTLDRLNPIPPEVREPVAPDDIP